ncbi:hypothetical protein [Metasolibacillus sp.]|uniref:hypothetical protein n=1 Tax=Metasolibacillus sp. TaxID=2703680 RepID=UPI0025DC0928|nr:hypothetical protein [Metasolibacillus sp.]MCT6922824.1 hypothetical protein [Metasolibacillus sp.]MCT6938837.1 hypothetical protein [Metasolibacillus sp.]
MFLKNVLERHAYHEAFIEEQLHIEKVVRESQQQMTDYLQQQRDLYQKIVRIESILQALFNVDDEELNSQLDKIIGKELTNGEE